MLHVTVIEDDSLDSQVMIMKGWLHFIFIKHKLSLHLKMACLFRVTIVP